MQVMKQSCPRASATIRAHETGYRPCNVSCTKQVIAFPDVVMDLEARVEKDGVPEQILHVGVHVVCYRDLPRVWRETDERALSLLSTARDHHASKPWCGRRTGCSSVLERGASVCLQW